MAVTIKEIAKAAGVSCQTVSAILGKKAHLYRPETQEKIRALAAELGYRRNMAASAMTRGDYGTIGLLSSTKPTVSAIAPVIDGIRTGLRNSAKAMRFLSMTDEELSCEDRIRSLVPELGVDGLLVAYTHTAPQILDELLLQYKVPAIWINNKRDHDCVFPDDLGMGELAVDTLTKIGHTRICIFARVPTRPWHYSVQDRLDGFANAMTQRGLTPKFKTYSTDCTNAERDAELCAWLQSDERPTAVFCLSHSDADSLYIAAATIGLKIPDDISILAMKDTNALDVGGHFSTIYLDTYRVGVEAVQMLFKKIAKPNKLLPPNAVPGRLRSGDEIAISCRPI